MKLPGKKSILENIVLKNEASWKEIYIGKCCTQK